MPAAAAVTVTVIAQEPLAGIEPPASRVTAAAPASGAKVPPQVLLAPGVLATTTPIGSVSVNGAVMLAAVPLELVSVMVRVEVPPAPMLAGLKALATVGRITGAAAVKVAIAGAVLLPLLVVNAPAASELT
jgi:hypothetical protein